jgi:DNA invertase Pin-like site-specific DNA recombinase
MISPGPLMPRAFGYLRPSRTEPSTDNQRQAIEGYFHSRLEPQGFCWAGWCEDRPEAATRPLTSRSGGLRLTATLEAGDAVLIALSHRCFANLHDLLRTCRAWMSRGVGVHLLDFGVHVNTPVGRLAFEILLRAADLLRQGHGERIRSAFLDRRRQGRPTGTAPYGFRTSGPKGDRRLVADPYTRNIGRQIVAWHQAGWTFERIYFDLLRQGVRKRNGKEWSLGAIHRAFVGECNLQAQEWKATGDLARQNEERGGRAINERRPSRPEE